VDTPVVYAINQYVLERMPLILHYVMDRVFVQHQIIVFAQIHIIQESIAQITNVMDCIGPMLLFVQDTAHVILQTTVPVTKDILVASANM